MTFSFFEVLVLTAAVWRLTHLLVMEDGPWKLLMRARNTLGGPFHCFACTSVWVAAGCFLVHWAWEPWPAWVILALSATALMVQGYYPPDWGEDNDVDRVLPTEPKASPGDSASDAT